MFHKLPSLLLVLILISSVLVACERDRTPVGGKAGGDISAPKFEVALNKSNLPGQSNVLEVSPSAPPPPIDGEKLYNANCAACHQAGGTGVPGAFPPLAASPYVTGDNVERLAAIMIYGLQGPIKVLGQEYNGVMAPLGRLKDDELAGIATYIRSAWSNGAGEVSSDIFSASRAKYGTRGMFNIEELGAEE